MKVAFDVVLVATGAVLSLLFFAELRDVREGTVLAAVGTGMVVAFWARVLAPVMRRVPKDPVPGIPAVVPEDLDRSLDENDDRGM